MAHQVLVYSLRVQYRLRAGYTLRCMHHLCTALYLHLIYNTPIPINSLISIYIQMHMYIHIFLKLQFEKDIFL